MPEDDAPPAGDEFKSISSQEELDQRIGERLARERQKFADYDDLKSKAEQFDAAEQARKDDLQKAQDAIAERDAKLTELPREVRKQVLRFASLATRKGFLDPEDALVFIDVDLADEDAVKTALDDLAKRKPHLVKASGSRLPGRPKPDEGSNDSSSLDALEGKERAAAALRQLRHS